MELFVVRHGETDWNKFGIVQGRTDVILNDEGKKQANIIKEKLQNITFDKCYVSPLLRARKTADIITDIPKIIDERLVERNFGNREGTELLHIDDIRKEWDYNLDYDGENIETIKELLNRVHLFKNDLYESNSDGKILIVSHGATLRAFHFELIGYDANTDFFNYKIDNCEVYKYVIENNKVISFEKIS